MMRKERITNMHNMPIGDAKKSPLGDLGVQDWKAATRNPVEALRYE
jgi:hypothetical protein